MMEQLASFSLSERQHTIYSLLKEHGHLSVAELAQKFQVSEMTIRRDLKSLASCGIIQRQHGGATFPNISPQADAHFFNRIGEAEKEKTAIGYAAAALIQPGDTIILDAGTSTLAVANAIENKELVVITNSIPISTVLSGQEEISVILTGGEVRNSTYALVGPITRSNLLNFNADKLFLGATGISLDRGLSTSNLFESEIKQAMIRSAKEVILVAHSLKFGQIYYHTFADWDEIDILITDSQLSSEIEKELSQRDIRVITVPI